MSESLVDHVARAIAKNAGGDYDKMRTRKVFYRKQARAAIAAMRKPTEAMIAAGEPVVYDCYSLEPGEGLDENPAIPTWQAMIDAALAEEEKA